MIKKELQERIANIVCKKNVDITCEECYLLETGEICKGFSRCRISEKTEQQLDYVVTPKDVCSFLSACAGSGKTEVVGLKAAYEMSQWTPYNQGIAVLTFTNEATNVINERVKQFTGKNSTYPHYIGTLSSFVHSYIVQPFAYKSREFQGKKGDYSFHIIDRNMHVYKNHWLKVYLCDVPYVDSKGRQIDIYANQIGYDFGKNDFYFIMGENNIQWFKEYYKSAAFQKYIRREKKTEWLFEDVKENFIKCKKAFWRDGFATFDDLNYLAVEVLYDKSLGRKLAERFPTIFIDECQDLSGNELKVLKLLQNRGCTIHCIGDLNQSIYEFKRVEPAEISEYVKNFKQKKLSINFRSCKEIISLSEKLVEGTGVKSENEESWFGNKALLYIEYENPEDTVEIYQKILDKLNFMEKENRILVRAKSLCIQLERSSHDNYDQKEPLIVAAQLWKKELPQQMSLALELAGKQISKWFGGEQTKVNYYCPREITSVYQWRIFLLNVLKDILQSDKLSNFTLTYGEWHKWGREELGEILEKNYFLIKDCDEKIDRDFSGLINGRNFQVAPKMGEILIGTLTENTKNSIPIMTIHGSKGCTFDSTLVISSKDGKSKGGHWKKHWLNGEGESKRIGYVASTRARYLLVWGIPKMIKEDRELIESYGFINGKDLLEDDCDVKESTY